MGRTGKAGKTPPLIDIADRFTPMLSFSNLVELHILAVMRHKQNISVQAIRKGIDFLRDRFGVERPLLHKDIMTDGRHLLIEHLGLLVNISQRGQTVIREALEDRLDRIAADEDGVYVKLYPDTRTSGESPKMVALTPFVCHGKPCITGTRLRTEIIASRYRAGDGVAFMADDYDRNAEEIEEAIRYEDSGRIAA